jgi:N-acetyl-gamma-glutamyl-phosphate reductase
MKKIGIFGTTGYAGLQLINLLNRHQSIEIKFAASNSYANKKLSSIYRQFKGEIDLTLVSTEKALTQIDTVDLVFLALPHTISMSIAKKIIIDNKKVKIIDLSGDFRFDDYEIYEKYYDTKHILKNYLDKFTYGLPELYREQIKKSQYVANPGCYPTSAILPLYPLIKEKVVGYKNIIIDSKSGLSGTGRKQNINFLFTESVNNVYAYNTGTHRHQPEIKDHLNGADLLFSPHIVPSVRGIFSTIYCQLEENVTAETIDALFKKYYEEEYFIRLTDEIPKVNQVQRTNYCDISFNLDLKNKRLILYACIDNLMKGAASQAIQNMNLMLGFDEKESIDNNLFYL